MLVWVGTLLTGIATSLLAKLIFQMAQTKLSWWQTALIALIFSLVAYFILQKYQNPPSRSKKQIHQKVDAEGDVDIKKTNISGENLGEAGINQHIKGRRVNIGDTSINSGD